MSRSPAPASPLINGTFYVPCPHRQAVHAVPIRQQQVFRLLCEQSAGLQGSGRVFVSLMLDSSDLHGVGASINGSRTNEQKIGLQLQLG